MSITVTDLTHHIVTLRRLHARVLEAEIELLRRAYGESIVEEALRLADEAAPQVSQVMSQELPPNRDERSSAIAEALDRVMRRERNCRSHRPRDEARRIVAVNIAKLPELLRKRCSAIGALTKINRLVMTERRFPPPWSINHTPSTR